MKKKNNFSFLVILLIVVCLSVGYSAYSIKLSINELGASIRLNKDIRVTGISIFSSDGEGVSNYEDYNVSSVSFGINLPKENSLVTYKINITNFESAEMGIFNITGLPDSLEYSISDDSYVLKDKICDNDKCNLGISKDIYITIGYKDGMFNSDSTIYDCKLNFDFRVFNLVSYVDIIGNYVNEVIDGDDLVIDFGDNAPSSVEIYLDDLLYTDFSYSNGVLSVNNVTGNLKVVSLDNVFSLANAPVLDDGMIPIVLSNTGVATTVASTDESWYNYNNKEWANVVLVDEDSRSTYLNTTDKTVNEDDILAYYVWVPRYKYRIKRKCSDINNSTIETYPECYIYSMADSDKELFIYWIQNMVIANFGVSNFTLEQAIQLVNLAFQSGFFEMNSVSLSVGSVVQMYNDSIDPDITYTISFNENNTVLDLGPSSIDILFETTASSILNGDAVNTYKTHPAFIWDGQTIGGIWVGKFETSGDATIPTIKPNLQSLRSQNVSNQFTTSLKFAGGTMNTSNGAVTFAGSNTYGLTNQTDSHMMKNSEWGALAYLSHSKYGINEEIYINNSENYYTGRSGGNVGGSTDTLTYGTYSWTGQTMNLDGSYGAVSDSTLGTKASTTGNVTGVYDMSGGAWEYVMGVLSDSNGKPRNGYSTDWNSGFNGTLYNGGTYTSGISFPESKYYDLYLESQFNVDMNTNMSLCTLETCGGHALNETAGWYNDFAYFVDQKYPWFLRGGVLGNDVTAGAFGSGNSYGNDYYNYGSWRSVLVVGDGV